MSNTKNAARDKHGVIVTLERRATGETVSAHRPGLKLTALRGLLAELDPREWRVVTISTPNTIMADLQRRSLAGFRRSPEQIMLGQVGGNAFL